MACNSSKVITDRAFGGMAGVGEVSILTVIEFNDFIGTGCQNRHKGTVLFLFQGEFYSGIGLQQQASHNHDSAI